MDHLTVKVIIAGSECYFRLTENQKLSLILTAFCERHNLSPDNMCLYLQEKRKYLDLERTAGEEKLLDGHILHATCKS